MDTYQPIYDAVRSKIVGIDIGFAIESAIREINFQHYAEMATESVRIAASDHSRPSVLFRPEVYIDGDQWCALYGTDLQRGVVGFGDSPEEAMWNFDQEWAKKIKRKEMKE